MHFLGRIKECVQISVGPFSFLQICGIMEYALFMMLFFISGYILMYVYKDGMNSVQFWKKRLCAIFPIYYITYIVAFIIAIIYAKNIEYRAPVWTFLFTVLGIDGWTKEIIPNFAMIGDWTVGCLLGVYLLFPLLYKLIKKYPKATIIIYTVLYLVFTLVFPFSWPRRNSIILRGYEMMLGMYALIWSQSAVIRGKNVLERLTQWPVSVRVGEVAKGIGEYLFPAVLLHQFLFDYFFLAYLQQKEFHPMLFLRILQINNFLANQ